MLLVSNFVRRPGFDGVLPIDLPILGIGFYGCFLGVTVPLAGINETGKGRGGD